MSLNKLRHNYTVKQYETFLMNEAELYVLIWTTLRDIYQIQKIKKGPSIFALLPLAYENINKCIYICLYV